MKIVMDDDVTDYVGKTCAIPDIVLSHCISRCCVSIVRRGGLCFKRKLVLAAKDLTSQFLGGIFLILWVDIHLLLYDDPPVQGWNVQILYDNLEERGSQDKTPDHKSTQTGCP